MLRILMSFVGGSGHYEPLVPIARAALAAGHHVDFVCRPSMAPIVAADGFCVHPIGTDDAEPTVVTALVPLDEEHEEAVIREGFARRLARERAAALCELCPRLAVDAVVCDEVDYGAQLAAGHLGLPCVTVLVLLTGSFARPDLIVEPLAAVRSELGLMSGGGANRLVVAPFPPVLRHPDFPLPPGALVVRPRALERSTTAQTGWWGGGRPAVYVTLGTIFTMESGDLFERVLEGLHRLAVDVVATVGRQRDPASFGVQPVHVRIASFVPQAQLLPECDVMVSHGGSGSVVGALAHGVPSVLLPMGADQPHNARRCEQLGVAIVLDPMTSTPVEVAAAVQRILDDPGYRRRAMAIADDVAASADPATVVPAIEQCCG